MAIESHVKCFLHPHDHSQVACATHTVSWHIVLIIVLVSLFCIFVSVKVMDNYSPQRTGKKQGTKACAHAHARAHVIARFHSLRRRPRQ